MLCLLTTSDARKQFNGLVGRSNEVDLVHLDRPYDLLLHPGRLELRQDDVECRVTEKSVVVSLLFRAPWEQTGNPTLTAQLLESFLLLEEALQIVNCTTLPSLTSWRRAYCKSSLVYLAEVLDSVPRSMLVDGTPSFLELPTLGRQIIKCGYGIHRKIGALSPVATVVPPNYVLKSNTAYRFLVQDYVEVVSEYRIYAVTRGKTWECLAFQVPKGTASEPDWRRTASADELDVTEAEPNRFVHLAQAIGSAFGLWYLCIDVVEGSTGLRVIDVNPHGAWNWLPKTAASAVDSLVASWFDHCLSNKSKFDASSAPA